ncbi:MAG: hypothetical protein GW770_04240 [Candidatus Altiarchaeum hamiconexum]|nr:hypothetical protein [Candidatus Altarchaeum hamiconexum]
MDCSTNKTIGGVIGRETRIRRRCMYKQNHWRGYWTRNENKKKVHVQTKPLEGLLAIVLLKRLKNSTKN